MAICFRRDMLEDVHIVGKAYCGGFIGGEGGRYIVPRRPGTGPDGHELAFELVLREGDLFVLGRAYGEI